MSKSKSGGVNTTEVEITNISGHGFWLISLDRGVARH
jgi:hypothetical protein